MFGLFDCLTQPGFNRVIFGRTVSTSEFRRVIALAEADPDFAERSGRYPRE